MLPQDAATTSRRRLRGKTVSDPADPQAAPGQPRVVSATRGSVGVVTRSAAAAASAASARQAGAEAKLGAGMPSDLEGESSDCSVRSPSDGEQGAGDGLGRLVRVSQRRKAQKAREVKVALADAMAGFRGAMTRRVLLAPDLAQMRV